MRRTKKFPARAAKQQPQTVHHHDHRAAFMPDHADRERNFTGQRERYQHYHRAEGDEKILFDDALSTLAQTERSEKIFKPVVHQDDIGLFERGI